MATVDAVRRRAVTASAESPVARLGRQASAAPTASKVVAWRRITS
jgi:hypothetical protein